MATAGEARAGSGQTSPGEINQEVGGIERMWEREVAHAAGVSRGGMGCQAHSFTHPFILVHTFERVLGEWVLSIPQLCHHGIQQLGEWTKRWEGNRTSDPNNVRPHYEPSRL